MTDVRLSPSGKVVSTTSGGPSQIVQQKKVTVAVLVSSIVQDVPTEICANMSTQLDHNFRAILAGVKGENLLCVALDTDIVIPGNWVSSTVYLEVEAAVSTDPSNWTQVANYQGFFPQPYLISNDEGVPVWGEYLAHIHTEGVNFDPKDLAGWVPGVPNIVIVRATASQTLDEATAQAVIRAQGGGPYAHGTTGATCLTVQEVTVA